VKIRVLSSLFFLILATGALFSAPRESSRARGGRVSARADIFTPPLASDGALAGTKLVAIGFSPGNAEQLVLSVINGAQKEIRVCAYAFTSRRIIRALVEARRRGVDVAVLVETPEPARRGGLQKAFAKNKLPHRFNSAGSVMHHKFVVADRGIVQLGSFNYTNAAAGNAENVVVLRGAAAAERYLREWRRLWDKAR
jgi:phosphatidylserine/phosphatidylglycerophosphate/cardiolipin synthase-like enzyme